MDPTQFDDLVRALVQPTSRRRTLGVLVGGALALVGEAAPGLAKRRQHHHASPRHKPGKAGPNAKPTCSKAGAACVTASDCCDHLDCTGNVCAKPAGGCASGQLKCGSGCCTPPSNGTATCAKGKCGFACNAGFTTCDGTCVDTSSDAANCGTCGNQCPAGTPDCCGGGCVDLATDANHCGSCNQVCAGNGQHATAECSSGKCGLICDAGFTDCDKDPSNGCEANTDTDPNHCGTCGTICSGTTPDCTNGACVCNDASCPSGQTCVGGSCQSGTCTNNGEPTCQAPGCGGSCYCDSKITGGTSCDNSFYNCAVCSSDADCVNAGLGSVCVDATGCTGACGSITTACATPCGTISAASVKAKKASRAGKLWRP